MNDDDAVIRDVEKSPSPEALHHQIQDRIGIKHL